MRFRRSLHRAAPRQSLMSDSCWPRLSETLNPRSRIKGEENLFVPSRYGDTPFSDFSAKITPPISSTSYEGASYFARMT